MRKISLGVGIALISLFATDGLYAASNAQGQSPSMANTGSQQCMVEGTWVGDLHPKHAETPPFTVTTVIKPATDGNLIGTATLSSDCLKGSTVDLQVTVEGSNVSLAGSDQDGNSVTIQGTLDKTGAILTSSYMINGSATGRCEIETGSGSLIKQ